MHATTDAAGRFYIPLLDGLPRECVVRASKDGHREVRRKLGEICAEHEYAPGAPCQAASFFAELSSQTPTPGAAAPAPSPTSESPASGAMP